MVSHSAEAPVLHGDRNLDAAPGLLGIAGTAVRLNLEGAVRTAVRGRRGWVGAVHSDYDPLDPAVAAQPHEAYRRLHATGRVHYNPRRATWILPGLADVRDALRATETVTSRDGVTRIRMRGQIVVLTDGEEHSRLRRQIQPAFTRGAMESWREFTTKLAAQLVDELIGKADGEVMSTLAVPMPMMLIAHILGVPDADIGNFRRWSEDTLRIMDANASLSGLRHARDGVTGLNSLRRYFMTRFRAGHLKDSETVLGRLVDPSKRNGGPDLSDTELFTIAVLLLLAGNETTTNLLGGMFETFARFPDQYQLVRENPELISMAVEEHLRFTSPLQNLYRYTRADYEVAGVTIPKGSRMLLSFGAANRDPSAFDEPDRYRVDRNPRTHVAFGHGAHMCIGAPLARMEAHAVLRELVDRVEHIELTAEPTWSTNSSLRGPTHLPVKLRRA